MQNLHIERSSFLGTNALNPDLLSRFLLCAVDKYYRQNLVPGTFLNSDLAGHFRLVFVLRVRIERSLQNFSNSAADMSETSILDTLVRSRSSWLIAVTPVSDELTTTYASLL